MRTHIMLLHDIILNASSFFHESFNFFDITKHLTLGNISTVIFKTQYLEKDSIEKLHENQEIFIRCGYFPGAVDTYI